MTNQPTDESTGFDMSPKNQATTQPALQPRMVSIYELRAKLMTLMQGYAWAEDALMDLWKLGAPDPSPASIPCGLAFGPHACAKAMNGQARCGIYGCAREKRILLPTQFEKWWGDVAKRQGSEFLARDILKPGVDSGSTRSTRRARRRKR